MRLLVIEDEPDAARMLAKGLRDHAYAVDVCTDGESGSYQASMAEYDAIVLDLMLPLKDGLTICREIRQRGSHVPVLMLTARDSLDARVEGLDSGGDDYLVKPFAFEELLARLRALIRRGARPRLPDVLAIGDLHLDTLAHRVRRGTRDIALTAREYSLLLYLARRVDEVVSRSDIAEHVWDENYDPFSNVIDVYIQRLRQKIDRPDQPSLIHTRRGEGYQLVPPGNTRDADAHD